MRASDTNVLARFFVDDADDAQAAKQRPAAVAALSERGLVTVTVLLELEWVMRGFYQLPASDISRVLRALASIQHITLEDRDAVLVAARVRQGSRFCGSAAPGAQLACFRIRDIRPRAGEAGKGAHAGAANRVAGLTFCRGARASGLIYSAGKSMWARSRRWASSARRRVMAPRMRAGSSRVAATWAVLVKSSRALAAATSATAG